LVTKISLARFFTMLSAMISSGISIVDSLEITADTADNVVISKTISEMREKIIGGVSLSACMREYSLFPPSAVHMTAIGEKSGSIDVMLMKSADYFNEETDYTISNLMTLLEPFLIFFVAVFVLMLALGVFLPMWNVMNLYTQ
jgi:type II secretory pathway component PulF